LLIFVAAERREFEGLLRHVDAIEKPDWPINFARKGKLNARAIALVANGPGPKRAGLATDVVKEHENVEGLVSTGFCGALEPALALCDVFAATEVIGSGPARVPASSRPFKTGRLLSIDRVVTTASEKNELRSAAEAVEMEAAAVSERARRWNLPFYAVRVVTDTADQDFPLDFNRTRSADGRFSRARIIAAALRRPAVLPELMKLNKTTKRAARALGDFLADARF
jgi:adenosylhomocysteine nucleosidase